MWRTDFVAPQHVGSSRTRARTHVPCSGRRTPNHCATREVPALDSLIKAKNKFEQLKELEKEEQTKPKAIGKKEIIKVREERNKIENRKKQKTASVGKNVEKLEPLCTVGGNVKVQLLWKTEFFVSSSKN